MTQHSADRGDAAGDVDVEGALDQAVGHLAARDVRVHFGEPGNQVLAAAIHPGAALGHLHLARGSDLDDPVAADDHGLVGNRPLAVHRNDGHVHEGVTRSGGVRGVTETSAAARTALVRNGMVGLLKRRGRKSAVAIRATAFLRFRRGSAAGGGRPPVGVLELLHERHQRFHRRRAGQAL